MKVAIAPKRASLHWKQVDLSWSDLMEWVEHPADVKESGNYILGTLTPDSELTHDGKLCVGMHRKREYVQQRNGLALDADSPVEDFVARVKKLGCRAIVHTTFSSTEDSPRYRVLIPLASSVEPEEYTEIAEEVMSRIGKESFDPGSSQPERYMFRPATDDHDSYAHWVFEGSTLDPADFSEDLSGKRPPRSEFRRKKNPLELEGTVGAFNRAYDNGWDRLIVDYELPYERVSANRYQLKGSKATAGMGPIEGRPNLVFSHHSNDPAAGVACSAFDLVRLHRFSQLDEDTSVPVNRRPSHEAMLKLASENSAAVRSLVGEDFASDDEWQFELKRSKRSGKLADVVHNWDLIRANDPIMASFRYNEMTLTGETSADLPWRSIRTGKELTDNDTTEFRFYLERTYGIRPGKDFVWELMRASATQSAYHPVRNYLNSLHWDGKPRMEFCLPGVEPTAYTRMVARKALIAAVTRIFEPGTKWDHMPVLVGREGIGKTWWIERMARGYYSTLGRLGDKDTVLAMRQSWILVSDEGHSFRKDEAEIQKEFLTRTSDTFRMPYDRETLSHPRHCVFWATTNDQTFLRRQEGNRRFLVVKCVNDVNFEAMTDDYVDQVWAEATYRYQLGNENLYLVQDEARLAAMEREPFVEEDALTGLVAEYLSTMVPEDWEERTLRDRAAWLRDRKDGFTTEGDTPLTRVCSMQVWVEALDRRASEANRADLLQIAESLRRLGWERVPKRVRLPEYGVQTVFCKV
jgi:predicted P-loop ATPase